MTELTTDTASVRKKRRVHRSIFAVLAIAALALWLTSPDYRQVAFPLVSTIAVATCFWLVIVGRSTVAPTAEIGSWFVAAVTLYAAIPLAVYLVIGQELTPFNDNRLLVIQADKFEIAAVGWLYVIFLASFAAAYLAFRGRLERTSLPKSLINQQTLTVVIAMWVVFQIVSFVFIPRISASSYGEGYSATASLPLIIRLLIKFSISWGLILTLAIRVWMFQDYSRRKWLIWLWISYDILQAILTPGARTGVVIALAATVMLYHYYVRPLRPRTAALLGLFTVVGFLALGVLRWGQGNGSVPISGGEFESLFTNAVDLRHRAATGELGHLPLSFYFADLLAVFPSSILPFVKQDPAVWYMTTFYPDAAEMGAGAAFGVIAQGVVGLGVPELILRGVVLGAAFAAIHRYFVRGGGKLWVVVLYVWTTVWAYQSFRNMSFLFVSSIIQVFVPLVLLVELVRIVLFRVAVVPSVAPRVTDEPSTGAVS